MLQWAKVMGCPWKIKDIFHVVVSREFFLEPWYVTYHINAPYKDAVVI
jgi:hypothetical protein